MSFDIKYYDADFICVGGGIAGMMAAINAANKVKKCIVIEKADARRSGSGGLGNDHFICYIPEVHGDYDKFIDDVMRLQNGARIRQMGLSWAKKFFFKTYEIVKLWESFGIPMKHNGEYYFAGHSLPGRTRAFLKYSGQNQKPILVKEALKRGVEIHNRRMGVELLISNDGAIEGVIALDTREKIIHIYRAKAVLLGTGLANNIWPNDRLGAPGASSHLLNLTGDGRAMAFRAGAELCNLEMPALHSGIKFFCRSGQATWEGVLRDSQGIPLGPFVDHPAPLYGDITMEVRKEFIAETNITKGPIFMDMSGLTKDQLLTMRHWLKQEGNCTLLRHLDEEKIDLMDTAVEFATYPMHMPPASGILFNDRSETNIPGLYAAGDEGYGGIAGACVTGWWAADNAAEYIKNKELCNINNHNDKINIIKEKCENILSRKNGSNWLEAMQALNNINKNYCGSIRNKNSLMHGLEYLKIVHKKAYDTISANNIHEMINCIGILNLYEISNLVFMMALDRNETRGYHKRIDKPLTDLRLNGKRHIICKKNNDTIISWR